MPSASPSPVKRPSLVQRTSSTHSLSSNSVKQTTTHRPRPHVVNRHSRNVSHGKNLSKLNRVNSAVNVTERPTHARKKSSATSPTQSPKAREPLKRNASHVLLTKNTSHVNLRKNHSANALALARNQSNGALKKLGLAPAPAPRADDKKTGFFELGDQSSGEEEEAEWEDSTTQSPELTRNNSKASTPARAHTPNGERAHARLPETHIARPQRTSSPPAPTIKTNNRSLPNLRRDVAVSPDEPIQDPALLNNNGRSSRAPPAVSTVSAHAGPTGLPRNESTRSFTHITHDDVPQANITPGSAVGGSSSADGGVSHFLTSTTPSSVTASNTVLDNPSDDDNLPSDFMSNYRPQVSDSPEKSRILNKARAQHTPSRTQQKLELQRRETMRAAGGPPATPPAPGMGLSAGSSISLHSRSGSRGRNRSLAEEIKALKQDYETGVKQLTVVRRFRNPILDSIERLKDSGLLPSDIGVSAPTAGANKSRPQSRRGPNLSNAASTTQLNNTHATATATAAAAAGQTNGASKSGPSNVTNTAAATANRTLQDQRSHSSPHVSRAAGGMHHRPTGQRQSTTTTSTAASTGGRVHFQRQGSHDDIGVTPSQGSPDDGRDDEDDGFSPEEALMRRIWESREIYEAGEATAVRG